LIKQRIALITDDPGWHGARLCEAFAVRDCEVQRVSLCDCAIDLVSAPQGLLIPGFEEQLPDGVFVRGVPGGTLEQVVLYLDVLHALEAVGIPVYNDGRAIERSVDKGMTSMLLQRAGIPVPPTWVVSSEERGQAIWARERTAGHRLVVKPLFGSQGKGLMRLSPQDPLPALADYQGVYYLQRYVEGQHFDWRIFVINGRAVAGMQRHGKHWINSVAQGATCIPAPQDRQLEELAEAATAALDMDYAGVDLMRDAGGDLQVIEVNSIPAWKGLQAACDVDIATGLVDDFYGRYLSRRRIVAVGE
jgi:tetrahydromethanopterin:alpha-L-glutamate ligase